MLEVWQCRRRARLLLVVLCISVVTRQVVRSSQSSSKIGPALTKDHQQPVAVTAPIRKPRSILQELFTAGDDGPANEIVIWGASIPGVPASLQGPYVAVVAGEEHVLALFSNGTITTYGQNTRGQVAVPVAARNGVKAIAAGAFHSLALLYDGTVVGWGSQAAAAVPAGLTGVVAIAAAANQSIALLQDGSVRAWGINACVDLSTVAAAGFVTAVAAGDQHLLFLMANGTVTGAGCNMHKRAEWPNYLPNTTVIAIAAGVEDSVALLSTGEVVVWGGGMDGQRAVPEAAKTGVVQVAASKNHFLARRKDGTVVAWGLMNGVLDVVPGSVASRQAISIAAGPQLSLAILKPVANLPPPPTGFPAPPIGINASTNGTAMQPPPRVVAPPPLTAPSSLNPPSSPPSSQHPPPAPAPHALPPSLIGPPPSMTPPTLQHPPPPSFPHPALQFPVPTPPSKQPPMGHPPPTTAPPPTFDLPILSPPFPQPALPRMPPPLPVPPPHISVIVFGPSPSPPPLPPPPPPQNTTLQTGEKDEPADAKEEYWGAVLLAATLNPGDTPFPDLGKDVVQISAGFTHAVALFRNGSVAAWGNNDLNQTVVPPGLTNVVEVSAGWDDTLARLSNGSIVGWDKSQKDALIPPDLPQSDVEHVAAGGSMSWAVLKNGSIYGWGSTFCGQLKYPPFDNVVSISSGQDHTLALLSNGTVAAWGCNQQDQLEVPPEVLGVTGRKVVKMVAGSYHNLALLDNGEVVTWGYSMYGLANIPEAAQLDVVDIAAGDAHSLVLRSDGSVIGWGRDDSGQVSTLMQQAGTGKVVAIAAGGNQSYAVTGNCCFRPLSAPAPSSETSAGNTKGLQGDILAAVILPPVLVLLAVAFIILSRSRHAGGWCLSQQLLSTVASLKGTTSMNKTAAAGGMKVHDSTTMDTKLSNRFVAAGGLGATSPIALDIAANILDLPAEDPFLGAAAGAYIWTSTNSDQVVEAGVTDDQLDVMASISSRPAAAAGSSSVTGGFHPVIQLTAQELRQQIRLISHGLISSDSTFVTFKCMWPVRFGSGLLAAKVMKDVTDLDPAAIQSFADEARLLSSINHDNVVKLYGYCLEAPTMCLIMELLPRNLHDVLYTIQAQVVDDNDVPGAHAVITIHEDATEATEDKTDPAKLLDGSAVSKTFPQAAGNDIRECNQQTAVSNYLLMPQILQLGSDIAAGLVGLQDQAGATPSEMAGDRSVTAATPATIIPRDIKPTGIWLNSQGVAKVCSVGMLRNGAESIPTQLCMDAGTIPYMPPEDLGERQDHHQRRYPTNQDGAEGSALATKLGVFSLGMTMWEMLAGRPPWSGMNELTMLHAITTGQRPRLPTGLNASPSKRHNSASRPGQHQGQDVDVPSRTDAPQAIYELINECWHQDIMNRPSAAEVFARLQCLSEAIGQELSAL